jgi:hypothetical protein
MFIPDGAVVPCCRGKFVLSHNMVAASAVDSDAQGGIVGYATYGVAVDSVRQLAQITVLTSYINSKPASWFGCVQI